jgi:hypothetical protein
VLLSVAVFGGDSADQSVQIFLKALHAGVGIVGASGHGFRDLINDSACRCWISATIFRMPVVPAEVRRRNLSSLKTR